MQVPNEKTSLFLDFVWTILAAMASGLVAATLYVAHVDAKADATAEAVQRLTSKQDKVDIMAVDVAVIKSQLEEIKASIEDLK